ncbi:MAG: hypothetical protein AABX00_02205 [Nanoarchaeota archaeon]
MKKTVLLIAILAISVFLAGCASKQGSYNNYNQQAQGQQGQYVGGGCGVAPMADYESTPVADFNNVDANL